jgi:hypothetical protein
MNSRLPAWALIEAQGEDRQAVLDARQRDTLQLTWTNGRPPRDWAKQQGWPTPWFSFDDAFVAKMFESDETFALALGGAGVRILIPKKSHTISPEELKELDSAYEDKLWRWLVEALREIRRAVEAGVVIEVDGSTLTSFDKFYRWAHGRYHALEDGFDGWIGDDSRL